MKTRKRLFKTAIVFALLTLPNASQALASGLGLHAGFNWSLGKASSNSVNQRTLNKLAIQALPGVRLGDLLVGVFGEYRFIGQNTEVSTVGNSNLKGSGYLVGVGAQYNLSDTLHVLGSFDFLGSYKLSNNTPAGLESTYTKPIGFRALAGWMILPADGVSLDLALAFHNYANNNLGSTSVDISENKLKHWDVGVGISVRL